MGHNVQSVDTIVNMNLNIKELIQLLVYSLPSLLNILSNINLNIKELIQLLMYSLPF